MRGIDVGAHVSAILYHFGHSGRSCDGRYAARAASFLAGFLGNNGASIRDVGTNSMRTEPSFSGVSFDCIWSVHWCIYGFLWWTDNGIPTVSVWGVLWVLHPGNDCTSWAVRCLHREERTGYKEKLAEMAFLHNTRTHWLYRVYEFVVSYFAPMGDASTLIIDGCLRCFPRVCPFEQFHVHCNDLCQHGGSKLRRDSEYDRSVGRLCHSCVHAPGGRDGPPPPPGVGSGPDVSKTDSHISHGKRDVLYILVVHHLRWVVQPATRLPRRGCRS